MSELKPAELNPEGNRGLTSPEEKWSSMLEEFLKVLFNFLEMKRARISGEAGWAVEVRAAPQAPPSY